MTMESLVSAEKKREGLKRKEDETKEMVKKCYYHPNFLSSPFPVKKMKDGALHGTAFDRQWDRSTKRGRGPQQERDCVNGQQRSGKEIHVSLYDCIVRICKCK